VHALLVSYCVKDNLMFSEPSVSLLKSVGRGSLSGVSDLGRTSVQNWDMYRLARLTPRVMLFPALGLQVLSRAAVDVRKRRALCISCWTALQI
jgi:hypothetical protein